MSFSYRIMTTYMEKYREMILDAAEIVLGTFGFDRTVYVDTKKRKGKWWQDLIHEEEMIG